MIALHPGEGHHAFLSEEMSDKVARIPKFKSEKEEAKFWATHDSVV